jgi:YrbI family 3-deoxy-D-manno-octulosonate 8-phosphate phosphatase
MASIGIKHIVTDFDGVLTDGKYYYGNRDDSLYRMVTLHANDSLAVMLMKRNGIKFSIMSSTTDPTIAKLKADFWGASFYHPPPFGKAEFIKTIANLYDTAYIGDSLDDIDVFKLVKWSCTPADALPIVRKSASYTLKRDGGRGCLLEAYLFVTEEYNGN